MKSLKRGRNCVAVSAGQLWSLDVYAVWKRKDNVDATILNGSARNFYRDDNEIGLTIKRTDKIGLQLVQTVYVYDFISTVHIW